MPPLELSPSAVRFMQCKLIFDTACGQIHSLKDTTNLFKHHIVVLERGWGGGLEAAVFLVHFFFKDL